MQIYEKDFLMKILEDMLTVRKFEQSASDSFIKGMISGNVHVCTGGEGAVVGANMALKPTDFITASHRGHGHCIVKSRDLNRTMAELFGKDSGLCYGRGGSMHVTKVENGMLGANGIVGGGIPIAAGSALASKIDDDGAVTVSFFGDGATNQGCFHECLNMAAIWKLPIIFFIENNQYAVSVDINTVINTETLAERANAYNIYNEVVDGTDVLLVYEATKRAVERARNGEGPTLIDCHIYRFTGHFVGDPAKYMSEDYLNQAHKSDVIDKFKDYLLYNNIAEKEEIEKMEKAIDEKIILAKQFAIESQVPDKSSVLDYNYSCDNERGVAR